MLALADAIRCPCALKNASAPAWDGVEEHPGVVMATKQTATTIVPALQSPLGICDAIVLSERMPVEAVFAPGLIRSCR